MHSSNSLRFPPAPPAAGAEALRLEVRAFLTERLADCKPAERAASWTIFDADFSRAVGAKGWIGMTWPRRYGGSERSAFDRHVVVEEMLAAGAPVAAHWFGDRQTGPLLLKFGTEHQRRSILPRIAAGTCYICIGMSEAGAGSDLAAIRTRAEPVDGGWRVNGTKSWTTHAQRSHYMVLLCRTSATAKDRHTGMTQLLVDLGSPGIRVQPIHDMTGAAHFSEVSFEDVFVPSDALIGKEGEGWPQVMGELAFERSGPERFLSSIRVLVELVRHVERQPTDAATVAVGRLLAHLVTLRRMSRGVAALLDANENPTLHASIVKDLGALLEQEIPEVARHLVDDAPDPSSTDAYAAVMAQTLLGSPSFSLRGGTREVLRGIIARALGLR